MPADLGTVVVRCPTCHQDVDVLLRVVEFSPATSIEVAPELDHTCAGPAEETA
ncbi:hypothetical protein [Embleya sp. NPDC005971]|uniref:hypothetical protein n=1 Tax=Embleya sp. NPDC005971 TaxID=3156724 RepID=UPI0033EDBB8B